MLNDEMMTTNKWIIVFITKNVYYPALGLGKHLGSIIAQNYDLTMNINKKTNKQKTQINK